MDGIRGLTGMVMVLMVLHGSNALYGFDCTGHLSNVTTFSLIDVEDCAVKEPRLNKTTFFGQLLQSNQYAKTHVYICSIKITRSVTSCGGWGSYAARVRNGEMSYFRDVGKDECKKMHDTRRVTIGDVTIDGVTPNGTIERPIDLAGSASETGRCKGASYSDPYGKWEDVVAAGFVEIELQDYEAPVQASTNKIKLQSGISCDHEATECIDINGGRAYWNKLPEVTCNVDKYSELYAGTMNKVTDLDTGEILYSLESEETTFALVKKGSVKMCGWTVSGTEHPKLFVLEDAEAIRQAKQKKIDTENMNMWAYINSKFVYVERYVRGEIERMYRDILRNRCELEKRVLKNALSIATLAPEEFGHALTGEPGYLGVIMGEVIHLIKCVRVALELRNTKDECFEQLPVFHGKEPWFLAPRTRILIKRGKPIPCDQRVPTMYKINNIWMKMTRDGLTISNPETLKPNTKPTWKYNTPEGLAISGIYSQADTDKLNNLMMFTAERGVVLNEIAKGMAGSSGGGQSLSIRAFIDEKTLESIAENTWNKMWSKFMSFGTASAGIIGLFMVMRLIKLLVDTILHGYAIYSIYGFSVHLIGSFLNSVTQLLLHLGHNERFKEHDPEKRRSETENKNQSLVKKDTDATAPEAGEGGDREAISPSIYPRFSYPSHEGRQELYV